MSPGLTDESRPLPRQEEGFDCLDVGQLVHVEVAKKVIRLGGWGLLPKARALDPPKLRLAPHPHDERAVRLHERQPVLKVRCGPERPELVVERAALDRRAGVERDGVETRAREDGLVASLEIGHVPGIESFQVGGLHGVELSAATFASRYKMTEGDLVAQIAFR